MGAGCFALYALRPLQGAKGGAPEAVQGAKGAVAGPNPDDDLLQAPMG